MKSPAYGDISPPAVNSCVVTPSKNSNSDGG